VFELHRRVTEEEAPGGEVTRAKACERLRARATSA
jgi:hypothetical protein